MTTHFSHAMTIVKSYQKQHNLPATLETLEHMQNHYHELSYNEQDAFCTAKNSFKRFFSPV